METKQYFMNRNYSIYKVNLWFAIITGVLGGLSIILLIAPGLFYNICMGLDLYLGNPFIFLFVVLILSLFLFIPSFRFVRKATKLPYLVISDDSIAVTNLDNGHVTVVYYKDIERIELSETELLRKNYKCINIYPVPGAFEKLSLRAQKNDRKRMETIYKKAGVIEQLYGYLLDLPIEAVFEDFQEVLKGYKEKK